MAARKEQMPYLKCAWAQAHEAQAAVAEKYKMSWTPKSQPAYLERSDDYGDESVAISEYQKQMAQQAGQSSVELDISGPQLHTLRDRELTGRLAGLEKAVWSDWDNHGRSDWDWNQGLSWNSSHSWS